MKKILLFALVIVSTLTCIAPKVGAFSPKNHNNFSYCSASRSNRANGKVTAPKPTDRGKPKKLVPAGSR